MITSLLNPCNKFCTCLGQIPLSDYKNILSSKQINKVQSQNKLHEKAELKLAQRDSLIKLLNQTGNMRILENYRRINTIREIQNTLIWGNQLHYIAYKKQNKVFYDHYETNLKLPQNEINKINIQNKDANRLYRKSRTKKDLSIALEAAESASNKLHDLQEFFIDELTPNKSDKPSLKPTETTSTTSKPEPAKATTKSTISSQQPKHQATETKSTQQPKNVTTPKTEKATPSGNEVYFTIQIMAHTQKVSRDKIKIAYNGTRAVIENTDGTWYRYSVGKFNNYNTAVSILKSEKIKGYVVAYNGKERISVTAAKKLILQLKE